ncbi:hypothetical protein M0R45_018476 [Rubus argutus]|uniref:Non-specific serine/threonine protein kinase n=1 Tax=Rubus argutus TaxID=59490 RepID=A0AAW1X4B1_RUBAR
MVEVIKVRRLWQHGGVGGDQFDYVFDWTILKYPQIGSSSGALASAKPALNPGPSAERTKRPSVRQDFRDRFSGAGRSIF